MTLAEVQQFATDNVLRFGNRDAFILAVLTAAEAKDETEAMMASRMARYIWDSTPRPPDA